ncbi:hypothetical protein D1872_174770 [compost metagenome]
MLGTKEIAAILEVQPVTVRKYAKALEDAGYIFERIDGKNREYNDMDVTAFKELVSICKRSGMPIEKVAELIAAKRIKDLQDGPSVSVVPIQEENNRYGELVNVIKEMADRNQQQAEQLERLHKRMDSQNANLTAILREMTETRRMVAAMNQKRWWQFWKKDLALPDLADPETVWKLNQKSEM